MKEALSMPENIIPVFWHVFSRGIHIIFAQSLMCKHLINYKELFLNSSVGHLGVILPAGGRRT